MNEQDDCPGAPGETTGAAARHRDASDVVHRLRQCAERFDYSQFLVARLPVSRRERFVDCLVVTSWPADFVRSYETIHLFACSRMVAAAAATKLPVSLDARFLSAEGSESIAAAALAETHRLTRSVALQVHSAVGDAYLIAFSGDRAPLSHAECMDLHYSSVSLFEALDLSLLEQAATREPLSIREMDCLRLAAGGKGSDEIAAFLGLSIFTVSGYFRSAARKLGAVNRLQAIACALRLDLI